VHRTGRGHGQQWTGIVQRDGLFRQQRCALLALIAQKKGTWKAEADEMPRQKAEALYSSQKILQHFLDSSSHRIFRHMHEALNIDKK
jgi:hypothetical protein